MQRFVTLVAITIQLKRCRISRRVEHRCQVKCQLIWCRFLGTLLMKIVSTSFESAPIQLLPLITTSITCHAGIIPRVDFSDDVSNLVDIARCHTKNQKDY